MKLMQEAKQTSGVPTEAMKKVLHEKKIRNGELMGKTNWEMETITVNFIFSNNCSSSCSNQIYFPVNIPVQPDWIFQRPNLTMDFVIDNQPQDPVG